MTQRTTHTVVLTVRCNTTGVDLEQLFAAVAAVPGVTAVDDVATYEHQPTGRHETALVYLPPTEEPTR